MRAQLRPSPGRPAGRERAAQREGGAATRGAGGPCVPPYHGGRAAPGPAGDLSAGRSAQGAGESAAAGEGGFGEVRFCQRGAGSPSRVSSSLAGPLSLTGI